MIQHWLANAISRLDDHRAMALCGYLASVVGRDGDVTLSVSAIAKAIKVGPKTVRALRDKLTNLGILRAQVSNGRASVWQLNLGTHTCLGTDDQPRHAADLGRTQPGHAADLGSTTQPGHAADLGSSRTRDKEPSLREGYVIPERETPDPLAGPPRDPMARQLVSLARGIVEEVTGQRPRWRQNVLQRVEARLHDFGDTTPEQIRELVVAWQTFAKAYDALPSKDRDSFHASPAASFPDYLADPTKYDSLARSWCAQNVSVATASRRDPDEQLKRERPTVEWLVEALQTMPIDEARRRCQSMPTRQQFSDLCKRHPDLAAAARAAVQRPQPQEVRP